MNTTIEWRNNREARTPYFREPSLWEVRDALTVIGAVIDRIHSLEIPSQATVFEATETYIHNLVRDELDLAALKRTIGKNMVVVYRDQHAVGFGGESIRNRVWARFWTFTLPLPKWIKFQ
jgi:hypothetical protein